MKSNYFEWDNLKNQTNLQKHGVDFKEAEKAFMDLDRVIAPDLEHSEKEERFFCFGKVGGKILTVRFTYRHEKIRIFGAAYWRKGKELYEKTNL